jgi:hypothetical protein
MARPDGRAPPSGQRWGAFVRNHMPQIAAMDLFVVPTLVFDLLDVLIIVRLTRRVVNAGAKMYQLAGANLHQ